MRTVVVCSFRWMSRPLYKWFSQTTKAARPYLHQWGALLLTGDITKLKIKMRGPRSYLACVEITKSTLFLSVKRHTYHVTNKSIACVITVTPEMRIYSGLGMINEYNFAPFTARW